MITIKNATIYLCGHCRKVYRTPRWVSYHERFCGKNPSNKHACFGCVWVVKIPAVGYVDSYGGDEAVNYDTFCCANPECDKYEMYSYKAERMMENNNFLMCSVLEEADKMPAECEHMAEHAEARDFTVNDVGAMPDTKDEYIRLAQPRLTRWTK